MAKKQAPDATKYAITLSTWQIFAKYGVYCAVGPTHLWEVNLFASKENIRGEGVGETKESAIKDAWEDLQNQFKTRILGESA